MDWYDRAEEYDRLFGWDTAPERDFILGASERWGVSGPRRFLEPFCGTGRLLRAMPGTAVGFDRNPHMVRFAHQECRVFRADAGRFAVRDQSFDCAFCLIDSFRYLVTEEAAERHLRAVGRALRPGAVYVLGFELEGDTSIEEWSEGDLRASVGMLGDDDPGTRIGTLRARLDLAGERIESFAPMRTYSGAQVRELVADEGSFRIAASCGRDYCLDRLLDLETQEGSVVLVLRKPV